MYGGLLPTIARKHWNYFLQITQDISSDAQIPAKYKGASTGQYNRVFGSIFNGRMNGAIVEAFSSKAALLAASPAFWASGAKLGRCC